MLRRAPSRPATTSHWLRLPRAPARLGRLISVMDGVTERVEELAALENDWDGVRSASYGSCGAGVSTEDCRVARGAAPWPAAVLPVPDRGVQVEWAVGPVKLEVEPGGRSAIPRPPRDGEHYGVGAKDEGRRGS